MATAEELHLKSVIRKVNISELKIDRSYQREPSQALVDDIAQNYDVVASELILVSDRGKREDDGGMFLVNGQHRTLAARKLQRGTMDARVVDLSGESDPAKIEAQLRLKTNVKLNDRPLERFKAQIRAGDPDSMLIVKILHRFDTHVNEKFMGEEGINAISTVESLMSADPTGALLSETLEVIRDTWGTFGGRAVSAAMMKAIAWFIETHGLDVDRNRLVTQLKSVGREAIHRNATNMKAAMGGSSWMNYYRAIVDAYNYNLTDKHKLEWRMKGAATFATRSKVGRSEPW